MQIFIKNSADGSGKTFTLDVEPSDTICVLRRLVCAKAQIPPEFQRLRYAEKILGLERVWGLASGNTLVDDDTQTLESYGIAEGATLTLSCRGTRKRELVPDELSWASTQKRRALSNAVEPHRETLCADPLLQQHAEATDELGLVGHAYNLPFGATDG